MQIHILFLIQIPINLPTWLLNEHLNNNCNFYDHQPNHRHSSNINPFEPHQLPRVGHPHRQIHQVLGM